MNRLGWLRSFANAVNLNTPDGGGGGGAAGGGDGGAGGDGGGGGAPSPSAFSADQEKTIARIVNAAVATHMERKLDSALSPIKTTLESLGVHRTQDGAQGGGSSQSGGGDAQGQNQGGQSEEVKRLQKALDQERQIRLDNEKKSLEAKRDGTLKDALNSTGVEPRRIRGAMAEVMANVRQLKDGSYVYISTAKGYDEEIPLAEGVKEWAETEVGKAYLAPKPGGGGSGTVPAHGGPRPGGRPVDPKQAKAERIAEARRQLPSLAAQLIGGGGQVQITGGEDK